MKPKFDTDRDYEDWEEGMEQKRALDDYFGEDAL